MTSGEHALWEAYMAQAAARARIGGFASALRRVQAAIEQLGPRVQNLCFGLLDMQPEDARAPRSWEVEREDFMRRLERS